MRRAARRTITTVARLPVLADRRGLRWLLGGRVMPGGALAIVTHRGRRSGRRYRTVVEVCFEDRERGELVLVPARGERSDWYRNVVAGGLERVRLRGQDRAVGWRRLTEDEARQALMRYREEHPLWGRMILWGMGRQHGVSGDVVAGVANAAPLVAVCSS